MYQEIIDLIRCPSCKNYLETVEISKQGEEIIQGRVICKCGKNWLIDSGILKFNVNEQKDGNQWSKIVKEFGSFEDFNKYIKDNTPQNQKELGLKAIDRVIEYINDQNPKYILDVATGRGTLLENVVNHIKLDDHFVCVDLSFFVLKNDRKVIKENYPDRKISYIACDVSNLPFMSNCFDLIVSYHGVANMRDEIKNALREIRRVLKEGNNKYFLDISILVKPDSKSIKKLKEFYNEREIFGIETFITKEGFRNFHKESGFSENKLEVLGSTIAKHNELDLVPVEGDSFTIGILFAQK
jgi:ubiquinone/menaquinone biosynthesis C-methylase UbiE/uncharacterized protein YbaR (Trm112 family)